MKKIWLYSLIGLAIAIIIGVIVGFNVGYPLAIKTTSGHTKEVQKNPFSETTIFIETNDNYNKANQTKNSLIWSIIFEITIFLTLSALKLKKK